MSRITTSMLSTNYLRNVNRNLNYIQNVQNQLSTGKKISKPSDDPYAASRIVQMYADVSENKQYNANITDVTNFLDVTDTSINQISSLYSRVRELLVQAGGAAYGSQQLKSIQDEMKVKVDQLAQLLNTSFDGKYVFGGTKIDSKPVTVVDGKLQYADADGNGMMVYKDSNGNYTTSATSNNTALNLSYVPKVEDKLKSELASLNLSEEPLTTEQEARKTEIEGMLAGGAIYVDAAGYYTTDPTSGTVVTLSTKDKTQTVQECMQRELDEINAITNSSLTTGQSTRITELNDMLSGMYSVYVDSAGNYSSDSEAGTEVSLDAAYPGAGGGTIREHLQGQLNTLSNTGLTSEQISRKTELTQMLSGASTAYEVSEGVYTTDSAAGSSVDLDHVIGVSVKDLLKDELKDLNNIDESSLTSAQLARKNELNGMLATPATSTTYVTLTGEYTSAATSKNTQVSISSLDRNEIQNDIRSLTAADPVANADRIAELNEIKQGIIYYNQSSADMKIEVSQGVTINYNKTAVEILEFTDPDDPTRTINVSDLFNDIINNLNSEEGKATLNGDNLKDLDKAISNLLKKSSEVGAMQNRMESAETQNKTENYNLTSILSSTEDIDFTETMIDFSTLMTVYKASLQISANILPQTIMDYL